MINHLKGRAASFNPHNKFLAHTLEVEETFLEHKHSEGEGEGNQTITQEVFPKTIVNRVASPDVGMSWSVNPYQGCEHGCAYCYARPTHEYWGYSAGLDFEQKIMVKPEAAKLLKAKLSSRQWNAEPIVLSGNTDCYQPIEKQWQITRSLLEVFAEMQHPVGIITKNALILRDLDILEKLASKNLIHVVISVTTLDESLRRTLEPRTASVEKRLETIRRLTAVGIPVTVMMAPIIPGINSHEIPSVLAAVKNAGARNARYTAVRLNGSVAQVFEQWLETNYPEKKHKVLNQVRSIHGGQVSDTRFGQRMRGEGHLAKWISDHFELCRKRYFGQPKPVKLDCSSLQKGRSAQLSFFE